MSDLPRVSFRVRIVYCVLLLLSAPKLEQFLSVYLCFLWFVSLSFLLFTIFLRIFLTQVLSSLYLFIYCSEFPALSLLVSFVIYLPHCLSFCVSSCPRVISFFTLLYRRLP